MPFRRIKRACESFVETLRSDQATQLPDDWFDSSCYKITTSQSVQAEVPPGSASPSTTDLFLISNARWFESMSSEERRKFRLRRAQDYDRFFQISPDKSMASKIGHQQDRTRKIESIISQHEDWQRKYGCLLPSEDIESERMTKLDYYRELRDICNTLECVYDRQLVLDDRSHTAQSVIRSPNSPPPTSYPHSNDTPIFSSPILGPTLCSSYPPSMESPTNSVPSQTSHSSTHWSGSTSHRDQDQSRSDDDDTFSGYDSGYVSEIDSDHDSLSDGAKDYEA